MFCDIDFHGYWNFLAKNWAEKTWYMGVPENFGWLNELSRSDHLKSWQPYAAVAYLQDTGSNLQGGSTFGFELENSEQIFQVFLPFLVLFVPQQQ